jgi:Zinc finger C-x8-C-x5-C-x3-H type (and similar)
MSNQKCKFFAKGYCRHGSSCRFSHEHLNAPRVPFVSAAASPLVSGPVGGDLQDFFEMDGHVNPDTVVMTFFRNTVKIDPPPYQQLPPTPDLSRLTQSPLGFGDLTLFYQLNECFLAISLERMGTDNDWYFKFFIDPTITGNSFIRISVNLHPRSGRNPFHIYYKTLSSFRINGNQWDTSGHEKDLAKEDECKLAFNYSANLNKIEWSISQQSQNLSLNRLQVYNLCLRYVSAFMSNLNRSTSITWKKQNLPSLSSASAANDSFAAEAFGFPSSTPAAAAATTYNTGFGMASAAAANTGFGMASAAASRPASFSSSSSFASPTPSSSFAARPASATPSSSFASRPASFSSSSSFASPTPSSSFAARPASATPSSSFASPPASFSSYSAFPSYPPAAPSITPPVSAFPLPAAPSFSSPPAAPSFTTPPSAFPPAAPSRPAYHPSNPSSNPFSSAFGVTRRSRLRRTSTKTRRSRSRRSRLRRSNGKTRRTNGKTRRSSTRFSS